MIDKTEAKKNSLNLEFHAESQKSNALLILLTTGILTFIGTFIWLRDNTLFGYGIVITLVIFILSAIFYYRTISRMKEILNEVENISD